MEGERKRIEERKEIEAQSAAGGGGCFIATVVYENDNHLDLIVLRSFRDNFLRNYKFGRGAARAVVVMILLMLFAGFYLALLARINKKISHE